MVHGIHSLLWAMDTWLRGCKKKIQLKSLQVNFVNPIRLDLLVHYLLKNQTGNQVRIDLVVDNVAVAIFEFHWGYDDGQNPQCFSKCMPAREKCIEANLDGLKNESGCVPLFSHGYKASSLFPNVKKFLPGLQIAQLLATSRLVGMKCPGLNSLYSGLEIEFCERNEESQQLHYKVSDFYQYFGLVVLSINSTNLSGTLKTFLCPPQQKQIDFDKLKDRVDPAEFANQSALVIGGSRGLGEVTAKLLAVGGAKVIITFHQGKNDAQRIVDEIANGGGSVTSFSLDVLDEDSTALVDRIKTSWNPTHLYYFATPNIGSGTKENFSPVLFRRFSEYYVLGFQRVVDQLISIGNLAGVFYPSSIFLEKFPTTMKEYVVAKKAGEMICSHIRNTNHNLEIYTPRLPKMATDQTASFVPEEIPDPSLILLKHLRRMKKY